MVLGKLPVPGSPTNLNDSRARPTALAVGAGGGCLDIFSLVYHFSFLSPSLWETARYRLKYCSERAVKPKTTNQLNLREGGGALAIGAGGGCLDIFFSRLSFLFSFSLSGRRLDID